MEVEQVSEEMPQHYLIVVKNPAGSITFREGIIYLPHPVWSTCGASPLIVVDCYSLPEVKVVILNDNRSYPSPAVSTIN